MIDESPAVILYDANGNPLGVSANKLEAKVAQGDAGGLATAWPVKITDNVYAAGVDAAGALYVSGKSATGAAPSSNPVLVGGIDYSGLKRALRTDAQGRVIVSMDNQQSTPVEVTYDQTFNAGAAGWYEGYDYVIPVGYKFTIGLMGVLSEDNRATMRFAKSLLAGSYDAATNTFTDSSAYSTPAFGAYIELEVQTTITGNGTYTITYVNEQGVAGRTATAAVPNGAVAGRKFLATLQIGDIGVRDITAVTETGSTAGTVTVLIGLRFAEIRCAVADTPYTLVPSAQSMILRAGEVLDLDYYVTGASNVRRVIRVVGVLEPI